MTRQQGVVGSNQCDPWGQYGLWFIRINKVTLYEAYEASGVVCETSGACIAMWDSLDLSHGFLHNTAYYLNVNIFEIVQSVNSQVDDSSGILILEKQSLSNIINCLGNYQKLQVTSWVYIVSYNNADIFRWSLQNSFATSLKDNN